MNYFLDLMYQLLAAPRQALRTVTRGEKLRQAALLWLFVNFLLSLSAILEGPELMTRFFLSVIVLGMGLFLHSAVTDYCAGFLGGRGRPRASPPASWRRPSRMPSPYSVPSSGGLRLRREPSRVGALPVELRAGRDRHQRELRLLHREGSAGGAHPVFALRGVLHGHFLRRSCGGRFRPRADERRGPHGGRSPEHLRRSGNFHLYLHMV